MGATVTAAYDSNPPPSNVIPFAAEPDEILAAEQAVIGAAFLDPARIPALAQILAMPGVFYRPAHETIWRAITTTAAAGQPLDPILLTNVLRTSGDLNRVGGPTYLHACINSTPTAALGEYYAELVRAAAERRRIAADTARLANLAGTGTADLDSLRAAAVETLTALAVGEDWTDPVPLDAASALPTFPVAALPQWVRQQVEAVAEFTQTPPDMAATMALAALATAAGGGSMSRSAPAGASRPTSTWCARCPRPAASPTCSPR